MTLSQADTRNLELLSHHAQVSLLTWFSNHARALPWREDRSPYRVWVSEIMLQQTQVETVQAYFERFMDCFPTLEALAAASLENVLRVWEGLGYYSRARALHRAAQIVVKDYQGHLPADPKMLQALPGIGAYTAGAIASLAFDVAVPAIDGNVRRVFARMLALENPTPVQLEVSARAWLPTENPGAFNEALIELGALVCRPRNPRCSVCPWMELCCGYKSGEPTAFPKRKPRKALPHYDVVAAVTIREDQRILIARRRPEDMLGGLWEFPGGKRQEGETLEAALRRELYEEMGITVEVGVQIAMVKHAYTHFRITLYAFECRLVAGEPQCIECADYRWAELEDLNSMPMAVTDRRIAQRVAGLLQTRA